MNVNKQLDDLEHRVEQLKASVAAAAEETHEQLKQRIDQAQADTERALVVATAVANQQANAAATEAQSSWEQTRSDAKARLDEFKAKAQRRADRVDANFAASDADLAEADAYAAIDAADWAVESARLAILDAIDARVYADEKAAALV
jgi:chromosome segregation ATPase